jgi:UDP-N-acetylmuramate--alanine ligase
LTPLDPATPVRVHVVGAGGAGMSAIATVLVEMGHEVSGSDLRDSAPLDRLRAGGVRVEVGHRPENLGEAVVVVYSSAVPEDNIELIEARRRGLRVEPRSGILAEITGLRRSIAVAGTHGKTTTCSMAALVLVEDGRHPSFVIGGDLNEIGANAVWDDGEWLVVEADESDGSFLELAPEIAVVTALEADHLEYYGGSFAELRRAFGRFVASGHACAIVSADDPHAFELADQAQGAVRTFGLSKGADYRVTNVELGRSTSSFDLDNRGESFGRFSIPIAGEHNVRNAAAAIATALETGADVEAARRALARFAGVARRFEFRGELRGVTLVDDYAHLPGEVSAMLAAARAGGYDRVVCVFQPHRFSRTQSLWHDFADAFIAADVVIVTGIYAAGEEPRPGVSGKLVVDAVLEAHPDADATYVPARDDLLAHLDTVLRPGDLLLTLGAGDLTSVPDAVLERWGGSARAG